MASQSRFVTAVIVGFLVSLIGCSTLTGQKRGAFKQATLQNPAIKCLCVWQQAEGPGLNGETVRGFTGQIFFLPREGDVPVVVQGDMKIFVFDDIGTDAEQSKPIYQLDVPSYELSARLGDTQFGPAYSVFVPYTRKGYHEANCAVRVKLNRPDGSVLFSDMAQVRLTGSSRPKAVKPSDGASLAAKAQADALDEDRPASSTIAVERDGKIQVVNQRLRYIGDATPGSKLTEESREERINELEAKLRQLQADQGR